MIVGIYKEWNWLDKYFFIRFRRIYVKGENMEGKSYMERKVLVKVVKRMISGNGYCRYLDKEKMYYVCMLEILYYIEKVSKN